MSELNETSPIKGRLTVIRGGLEGADSFEFIAPAIVGRFDPTVGPVDIDLGTIPEGSYVSRKHAKFELGDNGFTLCDLGSSNGTFVLRNDFERIEEPTELLHGDEVSFGNARFVFHIINSDSEVNGISEQESIENEPAQNTITDTE